MTMQFMMQIYSVRHAGAISLITCPHVEELAIDSNRTSWSETELREA